MNFLVDTDVISTARKEPRGGAVREAVESIPDEKFFLSVVTMGEIAKGIERLDEGPKRSELNKWYVHVANSVAERILPIDLPTAHAWGELTARCQRQGITVPTSDGLIAATAIRHGMTVMTMNARHFEGTGARTVNPAAVGE